MFRLMLRFAIRAPFRVPRPILAAPLAVALCLPLTATAQTKPAPDPDVLVLSNGDTLHGKLVDAAGGKVTFHSEPLGDVSVAWENIKELHTTGNFAVLDKTVTRRGKKHAAQIPMGKIDVAGQAVTVHTAAGPPPSAIPVKNAQYIVDQPTLDKQVNHRPSLATGWNGSATAGATLVAATQNQYTFSGALGLVRVVPTLSWLDPRNRTSVGFLGSYGKITEPAYRTPGGVTVPQLVTKSAIFHVDAERDEYFSPRLYALAQTAFDHNFSQNLQLQQIYGGGLGWTVLKTDKQEADLKGTVQYERQEFITGPSGSNANLVGSTFAATYLLNLKLVTFTQGVAFIPAYNDARAYSANETNTFAFPAYKNLSFSFGTIDSYLNNPPASLPPTKRNSFQFTMGLTYAIKSKY